MWTSKTQTWDPPHLTSDLYTETLGSEKIDISAAWFICHLWWTIQDDWVLLGLIFSYHWAKMHLIVFPWSSSFLLQIQLLFNLMKKFLKFNPILKKISNIHASVLYSLHSILQQIHFGVNFGGNESKHRNQYIHWELNSCSLERNEIR